MTNEEKLELINSMEIIDTDSDGESLYYVLVKNSKENIDKLKTIGATDSDLQNAIDLGDQSIDISSIVFTYTDASWFSHDASFIVKRKHGCEISKKQKIQIEKNDEKWYLYKLIDNYMGDYYDQEFQSEIKFCPYCGVKLDK